MPRKSSIRAGERIVCQSAASLHSGSVPIAARSGEVANQKLRTIPGMVPSPLHFPAGCKFHPRCPYNDQTRCVAEEPEFRRLRPATLPAAIMRGSRIFQKHRMPVYKAATVGCDESRLRRNASTMPVNPPSDNNKADVGSGTARLHERALWCGKFLTKLPQCAASLCRRADSLSPRPL